MRGVERGGRPFSRPSANGWGRWTRVADRVGCRLTLGVRTGWDTSTHMADFRTFHDGEPRPPTWAERDHLQALRDEGIDDVYLEPKDAPNEFWEAVLVTVHYHLAPAPDSTTAAPTWRAWEEEMTYSTGKRFTTNPKLSFENIVRSGLMITPERAEGATLGQRFAAIEHLLDVRGPSHAEFEDRVNDRARYFRVGVRMENGRFIPITSEHLHTEIVQPALLLLSDERFAEVDGLYRKAFDRALSGDSSGAITVAISAVEEMFRTLMPSMKGQTLGPLAEKARGDGIIAPAVEDFVKKLYGLRPDSDAHAGGTSDFDLAMFAIHLAGSILLYLGKAAPKPR